MKKIALQQYTRIIYVQVTSKYRSTRAWTYIVYIRCTLQVGMKGCRCTTAKKIKENCNAKRPFNLQGSQDKWPPRTCSWSKQPGFVSPALQMRMGPQTRWRKVLSKSIPTVSWYLQLDSYLWVSYDIRPCKLTRQNNTKYLMLTHVYEAWSKWSPEVHISAVSLPSSCNQLTLKGTCTARIKLTRSCHPFTTTKPSNLKMIQIHRTY